MRRRLPVLAIGVVVAVAAAAIALARNGDVVARQGGPGWSLAAVGDIACDPGSDHFHDGAGAPNHCRQFAVAGLVTGGGYDAFLALGDLQYEDATLAKFEESYDRSFGGLKAKTYPVPGNHEYLTHGASGYFDYFGERASDPSKGYYSVDLGTWHIVVLNSNCSKVGGCGAGSPQEEWLRADLASTEAGCVIGAWHHPRWSQGQYSDDDRTAALYSALYDGGADVLLVGHDHNYQRYAPRAPDGRVDEERGIREFVVGTGGKNLRPLASASDPLEFSDDGRYGILGLALYDGRYEWSFVDEADGTTTDRGAGSCR